ncbi:MAG: hypothetical protein ACTSWE_15250 [Promethearchaeota archaeon]
MTDKDKLLSKKPILYKIFHEFFRNEQGKLFNNKKILKYFVVFILVFVIFYLLFQGLSILLDYYIYPYWPLGRFRPYILISEFKFNFYELLVEFQYQIIFVFGILVVFFLILYFMYFKKVNLLFTIISGLVLIIFSNLLYGWIIGYVLPIDIEYGIFQYIKEIDDPIDYLRNFESNQLYLFRYQAKTHPPGAHFAFYILFLFFKTPGLIALGIGTFSTCFSALFFYLILKNYYSSDTARFITFLYLLLPSVQIYYIANLQALIATFFLGFLYFYLKKESILSLIGSILFLFICSFLTFLTFFLCMLIFFNEILHPNKKKTLKKLAFLMLSLFSFHLIIFLIFKYNYINSFLIASISENPRGFRLLVDPIDYFFTRVENCLEIILFFGPFLTALFLKGMEKLKENNLNLFKLTILAFLSLIILFLGGVYRTGETARTCLYIYPFLLFPIAQLKNSNELLKIEHFKLLILVFTQSLFMQFIGFYWW